MNMPDIVFRDLRLTVPENIQIIAFSNLFQYVKMLMEILAKTPEDVLKFHTEKSFGRPVDRIGIEFGVSHLYHVVRATILSSDSVNCTDKERRFFNLYHDFAVLNFEVNFKSMTKQITTDLLNRYHAICEMVDDVIEKDNNILESLIRVNDDHGKNIYKAYKDYFKYNIEKCRDMVAIYNKAMSEMKVDPEPAEPSQDPQTANDGEQDSAADNIEIQPAQDNDKSSDN